MSHKFEIMIVPTQKNSYLYGWYSLINGEHHGVVVTSSIHLLNPAMVERVKSSIREWLVLSDLDLEPEFEMSPRQTWPST